MNPATWLAFSAASIVLLMIPGPTVLLVVSYALTQGQAGRGRHGRRCRRSATSRR